MTDVTFTPPPAGMLSEQIDLPEHFVSLGLLHPDGAGIRVATWNGVDMRHMSPAAARRLANDLGLAGHIAPLAPVIAGLRKLADRALEIAEAVENAEPETLAEMEVEGHA